MNRRELLLSLAATGYIAGELWLPSRKIFLPPAGGWSLGRWDRVIPEGARGSLIQGWLFEADSPVPYLDMNVPVAISDGSIAPNGSMRPLASVPSALAQWQREAREPEITPVAMVLWKDSAGRIYHVDGELSKRLITAERARELCPNLPWEKT